jgi:hypothetical protein
MSGTFADGIEAAARVVENCKREVLVLGPVSRGYYAACEDITKEICALVKQDRVFASAPGGLDGYGYQQIFNAIADAVSTHGDAPISISVRKFTEALTAAPPGAPPVSAGEMERLRTELAAFDKLLAAPRELLDKLEAAEAKCRELEGEVARAKEHAREVYNIGASWSRKCAVAEASLTRLTLAAQAARGALEKIAKLTIETGIRKQAREALASLVAVLPGSGGAE